MTRSYCTYFDRHYLTRGLALIESLNEHEQEPFRLYAICLDEISRVILEKIAPPNVVPIPLHLIEQGDEALAAARGNRSLVEYYWTLTPTVLLRVFDMHPGIETLTYLDADLYFYSSPDPIFEEFAGHSVLIHGHRFSPSLMPLEVHGKYNVGLLCFRNDDRGNEVLRWWRDRCIEWCYARVEDGKFGDQLYLNDWPERFRGVRVLENVGAGVAPWNHEQYDYGTDARGFTLVDGTPLVFYHFHSLAFVIPEIVIPAKDTHYPMREEVVRLCVRPYLGSLTRSIAAIRGVLPDFSFGLVNNNLLAHEHTFVARKELTEAIRNLGVKHPTFDLGDGWECFLSGQTVYPASQEIQRSSQNTDPDGATAEELNRSGEEQYLRGDTAQAFRSFTEAVRLDPAFAPAHNNLGVYHWEKGNPAKALEHLSLAIGANPDDRSAILNTAEILASLGQYDDARGVYDLYLRNHPVDSEVGRLKAALGGR